MKNAKISFSVIVPLAEDASFSSLKNNLVSIENQTYKPKEIIYVGKRNLSQKIVNFLKNKMLVKIILIDLTKSAARNYGAKLAKGNFLIHIDVNDNPEPSAFNEARELIDKENAKAIIMQESVYKIHSFIQKVRSLEKEINKKYPYLDTPQIIETSLFHKVGGFDEEVDILDDWSLNFRLKRTGTKFFFTSSTNRIDEVSNLSKVLRRKFERGNYIPIFRKKYPEYEKISKSSIINVYFINLAVIFKKPILFLGLTILKPIEWFFLFLGTLNPTSYNLYQEKTEAKTYNKVRSNNYALYKAYCEEKSLEKLLIPLPNTALEIGAGTGRITSLLVTNGVKVTPTEPSEEMIKE